MNPTSNREEAQILAELGLTLSQATVYLALATFKDATARELYKATDIARQDVYQILCELQDLSLVERILAKPLRFRATPIKNAVSILIQRQESKNSELHNRALTIFSRFEQWEPSQEIRSDEPYFELGNVYRNDPRVKVAICNANFKIRLLDKNMHWPVFESFMEEWKFALEKGVKIEVLNELSKNREMAPKFVNALRKLNFEIRYAKTLPSGALLIFDNEEVAIWEGAKPRQVIKPAPLKALWSNHHGLIELAINHFESCWKTATPSEKS